MALSLELPIGWVATSTLPTKPSPTKPKIKSLNGWATSTGVALFYLAFVLAKAQVTGQVAPVESAPKM